MHNRLFYLLASFALLAYVSPAFASNDCKWLGGTYAKQDLPTVWDTTSFSDPAHPNPSGEYLYGVTAISWRTDFSKINLNSYGKDNVMIFTSIVTKDKARTFILGDRGGFILRYNPENVVGTSPHDTTFSFGEANNSAAYEAKFREYREKYPVSTPGEILDHTGKFWNNEVLLRGTSPGGNNVEIAAVFVWTDSNGNPTSKPSKAESKLLEFANANALPIVKFKAPYSTFYDLPMSAVRDQNTGKISKIVFQKNFKRYEFDFGNITAREFFVDKVISQDQLEIKPVVVLDGADLFEREVVAFLKESPDVKAELLQLFNSTPEKLDFTAARFRALLGG